MREGTNRLRIGALLLGVGLAFSVAVPTLAQTSEADGITVDDDGTTTIETDTAILEVDDEDGASISGPETRTDQEIFTDDFLDCVGDIGVSDAVTGTLENVLNEEETTETDHTPYNPVDEGSIEDVRVFDCDADPL
jgi:hypothetical protein